MNQYETVFILTPVLSEEQTKEAVKKYEDYITSNGGEFVLKEKRAEYGKQIVTSLATQLVEKYGVKYFPSPAGGCRLTENEFGVKVKQLLENDGKNRKLDNKIIRHILPTESFP